MTKKPIVLCILDGWGLSDREEGNAVALADTPVTDRFFAEYPHSAVDGSGEAVGLPDRQMGNSEVGHTNLGAGRIVYQELTRIGKEVKEGSFFTNPVLVEAMEAGKKNALHLLGLLSDGGVHSHIDHVKALLRFAKQSGVERVFLHAFLDGRDTPPRSGRGYLEQLEQYLAEVGVGRVATVTGRYYAMDRDKRWDRVEKAFRALAMGEGESAADSLAAVDAAYAAGENDEFVMPRIVTGTDGAPVARIGSEDAVIAFNFRPDRMREITRALAEPGFAEFDRGDWAPVGHYATMTSYDATFPYPVAYPPQRLSRILPELLAERGCKQLRIAETEKYAHVTYFFNGGREEKFPGEDRVLIPSPQDVATYDEKPEMSAYEVTDELVKRIESDTYDFILVNYANHDMVGHSGKLEAAKAAAVAVDRCLGKLAEALLPRGGILLVTADHGNSEQMIDPQTGEPHTAHTSNLVPFIMAGESVKAQRLRDGILADVAPTVLDLLGMDVPEEMNGKSLLVKT